jgi:hypothetical protein
MTPHTHLFAALLLLCAGPALAAHAHVHGQAKLDVAMDGARIAIHLDSPLDSLLGFEHAPATLAQVDAARAMVAKLRNPAALFVASPAAACKATAVKIESAAIPPAILAGGTAMPVKPGRGDHDDLDADFEFLCARPEALRQVEVRLFDAFPRLQRIDTQLISPRGQTAQRLSPNQRVLAW